MPGSPRVFPLLSSGLALVLLVVLLAGIGFWFVWQPGIEDHAKVDKAYFLQRLADVAGPDAQACDEEAFPPQGGPPPPCLSEAVASGRPFRATLVFRPWGNHELIYAGLVRDGDGRHWMLHFDPDRSGGYGKVRKPWLMTRRCPSFDLPETLKNGRLCAGDR